MDTIVGDRPKRMVWKSIQLVTRATLTALPSTRAGLEVEQLGLELLLLWVAGIPGASLTDCTTILILVIGVFSSIPPTPHPQIRSERESSFI